MPKLVRLSQGNHGINWTPWSTLVGGVYLNLFAFITGNSSLEPLFEGLSAQICIVRTDTFKTTKRDPGSMEIKKQENFCILINGSLNQNGFSLRSKCFGHFR